MKYIKISQATTNTTTPVSNVPLNRSFLANTLTNLNSASNVAGVMNFLATGNPLAAVASGVKSLLTDMSLTFTQMSQSLGLEIPKTSVSALQSETAEKNFTSLLQGNELDFYTRINSELEIATEAVQQAVKNFFEYSTGQIQVSAEQSGTVDSPTGSVQIAKKMHDRMMEDFERLFRLAQYFRDRYLPQIETVLLNRNPNRRTLIEGYIRAHRENIEAKYRKIEALYRQYASFKDIFPNLQQKRFLITKLNSLLPKLRSQLSVGLTVQNLVNSPGGLAENLKLIISEEKAARKILLDKIEELKPLIEKKPGLVEMRDFETTADNNSENLKFANNNLNIMFTNLIFENNNPINIKVAEVGDESEKTNVEGHYLLKIENPQVNLEQLYNDYISKDTKLSLSDQTELYDKILAKRQYAFVSYRDKIKNYIASETDTNKVKSFLTRIGLYIDEDKKLFAEDKNKLTEIRALLDANQTVDWSSFTGPFPQAPKMPSTTTTSTGVATGQPVLDEEKTDIEAWFQNFNKVLGASGVTLDPATLAGGPQAMIDSLWRQLLARNEAIGTLEGIFTELMLNPASLNINITADEKNKFIKVADDVKTVESDKEWEDYWNELYTQSKDPVPWGTIVHEKPKHPSKNISEEKQLHKNITQKFKKIE